MLCDKSIIVIPLIALLVESTWDDDTRNQVEQGDVGEVDVQEPERYVEDVPAGIGIHRHSTHGWPNM